MKKVPAANTLVRLHFTFTNPGKPGRYVEPHGAQRDNVSCRADQVPAVLRHYRAHSVEVKEADRYGYDPILVVPVDAAGEPAVTWLPRGWPDCGGRLSCQTLSRQQYNMRPPDRQRSLVYNWETAHMHSLRLVLPDVHSRAWELGSGEAWNLQLQDLLNRVKADYKLDKRLKLEISRQLKGGNYRPILHLIKLSPSYAHRWILLHELAHAVVDNRISPLGSKNKTASHGPEFVAVYVELLGRYLGIIPEAMLLYAEQRGVRYTSAAELDKLLERKQGEQV